MDNPLPPPGASNPETLIAACITMLSRRRFSACRDFALRLRPYLPSSADQILAITDVLSAADRRDWHSALRVRPSDLSSSLDLARNHFRDLTLLLDPSTNSFPLSSEAFTFIRQAWHVLSDPQRRHLYGQEIAGQYPSNTAPPPPPQYVHRTFWTACPYCWNMYEYEEEYVDCALRCEGCRKVFHGMAVTPPVREEEVMVEGQKRVYYSCQASVPLRFYEVLEMKNEKEETNKNMGEPDFVYISDDDDDDDVFGGSVRNAVQGNMDINNNGRVDLQRENNGKRTRVKTVAKKIGGNRRMRRQQGLSVDVDDGELDLDLDMGLDADDDDAGGKLEFTQGDNGDIFVGMRFGD